MISVEAVVVGRNDEYEPNWERNLFLSLAYNREQFARKGVDYRVAFVDWNSLPDRPPLAPRLVAALPFVRGIIVEPDVHTAICRSPQLSMVLTTAFNAGFRTTSADYSMGTCGDIFVGTSVVDRIASGLTASRYYRAERVSIRNDLPFESADPEMIEAPGNVTSVDSLTEPPYNKPPHTNASGDFSMMDTGTMYGVRGYDESINFARMHIDSRLGWTALSACDGCEILGRIFHISHEHSHSTDRTRKVPGRIYNYMAGLPYLNPENWGLGDFDWRRIADRLYSVHVPNGHANPPPDNLDPAVRERAKNVTQKLRDIRSAMQPDEPAGSTRIERNLFNSGLDVSPPARATATAGVINLDTGPQPWAVTCRLRYEPPVFDKQRYYWIKLEMTVDRGAVNVCLASDVSTYQCERFATSEDGSTRVFLPVNGAESRFVFLRNAIENGDSSFASLYSAHLISQPKQ